MDGREEHLLKGLSAGPDLAYTEILEFFFSKNIIFV